LEALEHILGMNAKKDREHGTTWIGQPQYVLNLLEEFDMANCRHADTPEDSNQDLPTYDTPQTNIDASRYRTLVGKLMYLMLSTRPDICHACGILSRHLQHPGEEHWKLCKGVLRYLKGTYDYGITMAKEQELKLIGYSDSDFAGEKTDRKSTGGYVFMLDGIISWSSKKQTCVALSSMEAEYIALSEAVKETIWLRRFLEELGFKQEEATTLFEDNQGTIAFAKDPIDQKRTKHIEVRYHFVREKVETKEVKLEYRNTKLMLADIMTKGLSKQLYTYMRNKMKVGRATNY
jgi:hypothetical protein